MTVRTSAVVAIAVGVAIGGWLLTRGGGHSTPTTSTTTATGVHTVTPIGPVSIAPGDLKRLSAALHQPIYWVGPETGYSYEVTVTANGSVYVRYLPPGVKIGDPRSNFLIVSTYPFPNALSALKGVANGHGHTLANGVFALPDPAYAESIHLAYPNVEYQIEVYDYVPARARQVALSGRVQAVR